MSRLPSLRISLPSALRLALAGFGALALLACSDDVGTSVADASASHDSGKSDGSVVADSSAQPDTGPSDSSTDVTRDQEAPGKYVSYCGDAFSPDVYYKTCTVTGLTCEVAQAPGNAANAVCCNGTWRITPVDKDAGGNVPHNHGKIVPGSCDAD